MIAVDTNILVRFLTNDDKKQAELARRAMRDNEIWLSKTVLLETEWVLRYSYDFDPRQILGGFRALLGLSNLRMEDPAQVTTALNGYAAGLDFADALHVAGAQPWPFYTFDQKLIKKSAPSAVVRHP